MRYLSFTGFAVVALLGLSACETSSGGSGGIGGMTQSQTLGTGAGAAAGGVAGYFISGSPIGAVVGAAAGGLIGNRLANYLSDDAHEVAADAAVRAASVPTGQHVTWQKTDAFFQPEWTGWASPTNEPFQDGRGRNCRNIRLSATKDGNTQQDNITLCQGSSGWAPA